MIGRPFWLKRIQAAWRLRPIVWLAGVRRSGKTTLARMLKESVYLNCDLPSVAHQVEDPELFLGSIPHDATLVLDEVHRLADPSRLLKIIADTRPRCRVLATGSSTLAATRKFRDTLTGRKTVLHLCPVLWTESGQGFGPPGLDHRLLRGGLPEFLLLDSIPLEFYAEWLDSFYARDILELFGIRERTGFLDLLRLMLRQSGGLVDYSALARECDLSRPTIKAHLEAMVVACALNLVVPFHGGGRKEIVRRPKAYAFDTGFVTFIRGWTNIRGEDRGPLWEHLVLDVLRASNAGEVRFWRDRAGREVDFVRVRGSAVDAYECKINPDRLDPANLLAFRSAYPRGSNFLVAPGVSSAYPIRLGKLIVNVIGCEDLIRVQARGRASAP